jgi:hypothetical protein
MAGTSSAQTPQRTLEVSGRLGSMAPSVSNAMGVTISGEAPRDPGLPRRRHRWIRRRRHGGDAVLVAYNRVPEVDRVEG